MGCWNHTCFLSNLAITYGEEMAVMTLVKTSPGMSELSPLAYYYPAPVMFYGKYDDYGGIEGGYGTQIDYLLQEFIDNGTLKEGTTIEEFIRLGDQGGLILSNIKSFHKSLRGDKNPHVPVKHLAIKKSVLDNLLERFSFPVLGIKDEKSEYIPIIPITHKHLRNLIPVYIDKLIAHHKDEDDFIKRWQPIPELHWRDPDTLGQHIKSFTENVTYDFFRQSFLNKLRTLAEVENREALTELLEEFCRYIIIRMYMVLSRRVFIRPNCSSQETDSMAQELMAKITLDVAYQDNKERRDEEDAWDPVRKVFIKQCEIKF